MSSLVLAYNTNGLAHHNLLDAIALLAGFGYRGVSITLDHRALNPYDEQLEAQVKQVSAALEKFRFRCVIETGGRFLLDLTTKHEPTLVTAHLTGRAKRVDFYRRAIDIAVRLNADCVSLWSGVVHDGVSLREAMDRLTSGLVEVLDYAERRDMLLAFEPEPGMLIDTLARYDDLLDELSRRRVDTGRLRLTIDIGHLHCQGEVPIAAQIERYADRLSNVHIEDMCSGVHEHLMFGEGEIDFRPLIATLAKIGYAGLVSVELSRHSHEGPDAARRAYDFLWPLVQAAAAEGRQTPRS
jgi:L-ribulose-5-phosphate 3-epimerase